MQIFETPEDAFWYYFTFKIHFHIIYMQRRNSVEKKKLFSTSLWEIFQHTILTIQILIEYAI